MVLRSRIQRRLRTWLLIGVVSVILLTILRLFVFQTFVVPSDSMVPTLSAGDRILVIRSPFVFHPITVGDIIVFKKPRNFSGDPNAQYLVKRVIGLPGETISERKGIVYVNNKALREPWLSKRERDATYNLKTQRIPADKYFVMGDNRLLSEDSRLFGAISSSVIVGQVVFRLWPVSRFGSP